MLFIYYEIIYSAKTKQYKFNISQPEPEIFIRGQVEGWISCIYVFVLMFFSRSFSVSFLLLYVVFLFMFLCSPSLFKLFVCCSLFVSGKLK